MPVGAKKRGDRCEAMMDVLEVGSVGGCMEEGWRIRLEAVCCEILKALLVSWSPNHLL